MSFNVSAWSIRRPVPTIVLFLMLTILGWFSFTRLGIDTNPNIDIPAISIRVSQPGAGPAELESQVTKQIEDAVASLGNIDSMISTVNDGVSTTVVNFVWVLIAIAPRMMSAMQLPKLVKIYRKTSANRSSSA